MEFEQAAIRCTDISKSFLTYKRPLDRLLQGLKPIHRFIRAKGKSRTMRFSALENIDFVVVKGETMGIIGRNGAGKSTLLQIIAGTLTPDIGSVRASGRVSALLELGAGFNPEFTGIENIRLNGSLLGLSQKTIAGRMSSILKFADIGGHADLPVKTYSSGMFVRLAFSVVVHSSPDILIIDEALAVGNAAFQAKCMLWMQRFKQSGGTLLFVSHDISAVRTLCDRAVYLEKGRMKDIGPVGSVTDHYLRDLHDEQNNLITVPSENLGAFTNPKTPPKSFAFNDPRYAAFEHQWATVRQGTGEARVRFAEILDAGGASPGVYEFDEPVRIRIHAECFRPCTVSVNYKIRDRQLVSVIGCDFLIAGQDLLSMEPGVLYVVEYATRLAITAGNYTLRFSITIPVDRHRQAVFVDIVEVALPFKIMPPKAGWIYTQAYLPNTITLESRSIGAEKLNEVANGTT